MDLSEIEHRGGVPGVCFPDAYNAAHDLLQRNLLAGRADKTAYMDDAGSCTYGELDARSSAFAALLERALRHHRPAGARLPGAHRRR